MRQNLDRRDFLGLGVAAMTAGAMLAGCKTESSASAAPAVLAPAFKISLAEWSLHRRLRAGDMTNLDFPSVARKEFGIEAIEFVNSFFKDKSRDQAYLAELRKRANAEGTRMLLIMVDGEGRLGGTTERERAEAVSHHTRWLEAAKDLGCHSIRVNASSEGPRSEQLRLLADGMHALVTIGASMGVNVIVENHGGLSSDGAFLAELMRTVNHPCFGTLPDFGNFTIAAGQEYDRYKGVAELMPWAKAVSAKSHDFDSHGLETHTDYPRMLDIVLDAGYHGHLGIEYEGGKLSEAEGILATKRLLEVILQSHA
jgi:sugar phosphate isomerase/epimerase